MTQLTTVPLLKHDKVLLNNFIGAKNAQIKTHINQLLTSAKDRIFYFYGAKGSGKTHLLQAYFIDAVNAKTSATYLNCATDKLNTDELLKFDWICIDNINASNKETQYALYSIYNFAKLNQKILMLSGNASANNLANITLRDLKTRLSLAHSFELEILNNDNKKQILAKKMQQQNIIIADEIYDYLLLNHSRNLSVLVKALTDINTSAIKKGKKHISLNFVKKWHKPNLI